MLFVIQYYKYTNSKALFDLSDLFKHKLHNHGYCQALLSYRVIN